MASSDFLFSWTLEKGILKPAHAGKPFTSLADLHKWARRNRFNSIAQHNHIVYTELEEHKKC